MTVNCAFFKKKSNHTPLEVDTIFVGPGACLQKDSFKESNIK